MCAVVHVRVKTGVTPGGAFPTQHVEEKKRINKKRTLRLHGALFKNVNYGNRSHEEFWQLAEYLTSC